MRFWRSVRERTEIIILVVCTLLVGFWSQLSRLSLLQVMFAAFRPGEYVNPGAVPLLRPIIPARDGPVRFSPRDVEWQPAQFASKNRLPSEGPTASCCDGTSVNNRNEAGHNSSNRNPLISNSRRGLARLIFANRQCGR